MFFKLLRIVDVTSNPPNPSLEKLIFTHIYVESDYDQMLQHVIPAKAGIQRLANISYVYMEGLI
jgi:hypothetical protein